jgi:hypothetical protein
MEPRCEHTRELAAELALGVLEGEERGRALEHLADCPECRHRVEELSEVADQLLLLAPQREAPIGFESRVLSKVLPAAEPPRRRRRLQLVLAPVAAALAAVAITLAIVSDDLRTAHHYRDTLTRANGTEFEAYSLETESGQLAGTVFSYQGSPSWIQIDVDPAYRATLTGAQLITDDGTQIPLGWFRLDRWGSSGGGIPVEPRQVSVLRLQSAAGEEPLVAHLGG